MNKDIQINIGDKYIAVKVETKHFIVITDIGELKTEYDYKRIVVYKTNYSLNTMAEYYDDFIKRIKDKYYIKYG